MHLLKFDGRESRTLVPRTSHQSRAPLSSISDHLDRREHWPSAPLLPARDQVHVDSIKSMQMANEQDPALLPSFQASDSALDLTKQEGHSSPYSSHDSMDEPLQVDV